MEIRPDKKLITKSWLILITISIFIVIFAFAFYLIPTLDSDVDFSGFIRYLWGIVILTIALMWIISAPIMLLWIKNLSYFLEEDRIVVHKGILTKVQQNIPLRMITDFMLERSLYDRWLGIGSIKIQTAGQSQNSTGYEGKLAGLVNWGELHTKLRAKISNAKTAENEIIEPDKSETLAEILQELQKIGKILEGKK